jgi:preprotein translocase subunit YajC|nr:MAG TPA: TMEM61 protein family [Caudoviricetes sp.]
MTIEEVLTLISSIAFICCQGCLIVFCIMLWRQNRARKKREEEYERDLEALQNLSGDEYWKAYNEFKQKYIK